MKFLVNGKIKKNSAFKIEVEADSKSYAKEIAYIKLGSKQKIKKHNIEILEIKEIGK